MARWYTVPALAIGCPLAAFWLIRGELFDAIWFALPDAILTIFLLLGLPLNPRPRNILIFALSLTGCLGLLWNHRLTAMLMPVLMNLTLALIFLSTLARGEVPLITRIASRVRAGNALPKVLQTYTRTLTGLWGTLFILLAMTGLYWALSNDMVQSMLFANTFNFYIMATFFVLEHVFRFIRYRHLETASPLHVLRVMLQDGWHLSKK